MRIVHISDLHLRHHLPGTSTNPERLSRSMPELFARAVEQIVKLDPDLFVLSGDLIDFPLDELDDLELQQRAAEDYHLIQDLIRPLSCPMAIVYGNHDHPQIFHEVFSSLQQDQTVCGHRVLTFLDDEGAEHVPQRVGDEQRRFDDALGATDALPQIHVQHYVVWPERNEEYPHTYGVGKEMRNRTTESGAVELLLSGHYHPGVEPLHDNGVWFVTVPAFGEPPHPYWVYELNDRQLRHTQVLPGDKYAHD